MAGRKESGMIGRIHYLACGFRHTTVPPACGADFVMQWVCKACKVKIIMWINTDNDGNNV